MRRIKQWICGKMFNHRPLSNDSGYLIGSKMCDKWCRRCGKMVQIPVVEEPRYDLNPPPTNERNEGV